MPPIPDLVYLSRLEVQFSPDLQDIRQITSSTGASPGRRKIREQQRWTRERQLGRGGFGLVYLERCLEGSRQGELRAVKELRKLANASYNRELEAAALFSHSRYEENFVKSFGWYETADSIYMTMEYLPHGDLQKYLGSAIPEGEGQSIVYQVLEGLEFMHERGFTHRDLKPAVSTSKEEINRWMWVVLTRASSTEHTGIVTWPAMIFTPAFAAPEVFFMHMMEEETNAYTNAVDIWSAGVITANILTGEAVFDDRRRLMQYCRGKAGVVIDGLHAHDVSEDGHIFVEALLAIEPEDRPTAKDCLRHSWLKHAQEPVQEQQKDFTTSLSSNAASTQQVTPNSVQEPSAKWSTMEEGSSKPSTAARLSDIPYAQAFTDASLDESGHVGSSMSAVESSESTTSTVDQVNTPKCSVTDDTSSAPSVGPSKRSNLQSEINDKMTPEHELRENDLNSLPNNVNRQDVGNMSSGTRFLPQESQMSLPVRPVTLSRRNLPTEVEVSPGQYAIGLRDSGYVSTAALSWRDNTTLQGHTASITAIAFSPDGRYLFSASGDQTVRLWDTMSGRLLSHERTHEHDHAEHIAISPDSKTMVSRSGRGQIMLWDINSARLYPMLELAADSEYGSPPVEFSPNGHLIAWIDLDGAVTIHNLVTGMLQTTVTHSNRNHAHLKGNVKTFAFSPNSNYLVSGSDVGSYDPVSLWAVTSGRKLATLQSSSDQHVTVWQVAFSGDNHIAAALSDGTIRLWNSGGRLIQTWEAGSHRVNDVAFSPDCRTLASALDDGTVRIWHRATGIMRSAVVHNEDVEAVEFAPDGRFLASASQDMLKLWNPINERLLLVADEADLSSRGCFAFSPDSRILAYTTGAEVRLFDLEIYAKLASVIDFESQNGGHPT